MKIHKEGYPTLGIVLFILTLINVLVWYFAKNVPYLSGLTIFCSAIFYLFFVQFFRVPNRLPTINQNQIISPCDGKVVVIEQTHEDEYFKDKRIQVSIFMSPFNVHINWFPLDGIVAYFKYHAGKYLVAWHPKSSTENERTTMVIKRRDGVEILVRQIAGAVARRIVWYAKEGNKATQGKEYGFIKFGSRVDLFLPIGTKINVQIDDKTIGSQTVIAEL